MTAHDQPTRPAMPRAEPHELRADAERGLADGQHAAAAVSALLAIAGELSTIRRLLQKRK